MFFVGCHGMIIFMASFVSVRGNPAGYRGTMVQNRDFFKHISGLVEPC